MFLKHVKNNSAIEVLGFDDLINPNHPKLAGRYTAGEELQDPENFLKSELQFLSGEPLPKCWVDVHYRDDELKR